MTGFFRFPHTSHLLWLGSGAPRDDKVLSLAEAESMLAGEVVVEEKLDGANLGVSFGADGALRFQNRGQYLEEPFSGQFQRLPEWIARHQSALCEELGEHQILFGEWCAARHSVAYDRLPDWLFVFDVYDPTEGRFMSTARRDALAARAGLDVVPVLFRGSATLAGLKDRLMSATSRFRSGAIEGLVVRRESGNWLTTRAKLVHPEFVQNIGEHWRRRRIEWNRLQRAPGLPTQHGVRP